MEITLRQEELQDWEAIRTVNRLAFGQDAEVRLVDSLRENNYVRLSLVAEREGQVVGHILFSELPIQTFEGKVLALALAPMAVLPEYQNQGIGSVLVRRGLDLCKEKGHTIVIVLGHPNFYPRFGFSPALATQLQSPYAGEAFMALELVPGAMKGLTGQVEYPPPFAEF